MRLERREIVPLVLLSIFTCGIYPLYWLVVVTDEIESALEVKDGSVSNGANALIFTFLTCGIYSLYWYYKQGERIHRLGVENNVRINDNSALYLILSLFGFSIVAMILMQSDLNQIISYGEKKRYDSQKGIY